MEDAKSIPLSVYQDLNTTTAVASQCAGVISSSSGVKIEDVTTHTYQAASCSSDVQGAAIKEEFDASEMNPKDTEGKLESEVNCH